MAVRQDQVVERSEEPVAFAECGPAGVAAAAADLAAAFVNDPLWTWFSRMDASRDVERERFFDFVLSEAVLPNGMLFHLVGGGAAAAWLPSEHLSGGSVGLLMRAVGRARNLTGWRRLPRFLVMNAAIERHHPRQEPHDYLMFLGVAPSSQGRGIGSNLLRARLDVLDHEGRPAFLETATEANVRLYSRFGFQVISAFQPMAGAPLIRAMWRAPAARSSPKDRQQG